MAKIVKFPHQSDDMLASLKEIIERLENGEIISYIFAASLTDGCIATSYGCADWGTRMTLIGHMQADVMWGMVEANIDFD